MTRFGNHPDHLANALRDLLVRHDLGKGVAELGELNDAWYQAAGDRWRDNSWVLGWRGAELMVGVTSPAAASRLRFEGPVIAKRIQKAGWSNLNGVRAQVQPQEVAARRHRHRHYSRQAANGVVESAAEVTDPELRAALERLAGHLAPSEEGD
ncbi:DciA family protein [Thiohalorhabdus sp.]|uniref:DciA family protein n=1 Tax=Thiohalorhabdus sp. TaxID=3094134 RepID=UPI002FC33C58